MSIKRNSSDREENQEESRIKVFIRIRPFRNEFSKRCLKLIDKGVALNYRDKIHQWYFDEIFDEDAKQERVFNTTCRPLLNHVLEGNNGSLFVYGQTGTGKTYTMGTLEAIKREDQGMIPLSLRFLFQELPTYRKESEWWIRLSFMQIYKQQIHDLLNPKNNKLQIRQDNQAEDIYVEDLTIVQVKNYKESIELLNAGLEYRITGNQKMNQLSSRSHTILTIYVTQKISSTQYMTSNFSLIDLAGSERVKKSNSVGQRLEEAKFINTSLSALGSVISGLAENNDNRFIPYRSSKLTRILKNSLSGRSRVGVICTLELSEENSNQTYSTLIFANRCKQIRFANQPVINVEEFQQMGQDRELREEVMMLRQKEQQYLQTIRQLQQQQAVPIGKAGSPNLALAAVNSQRQLELSQLLQSTFKVFTQFNKHLRKVLGLEQKPELPKQKVKIVKTTTGKQIKSTITTLAQETIQYINSLSEIATNSKGSSKANIQTETLSSMVLELVRNNLRLYETLQSQLGKQPLEKEIAVEEYEKQLKQGILTKLRDKKLKVLSTFQEIWSENDVPSNPLQSLLHSLRKGETSIGDPPHLRKDPVLTALNPPAHQQEYNQNNPKDILKKITKLEASERKNMMNKSQVAGPGTGERPPPLDDDYSEPKPAYFKTSTPVQSATPVRFFQKSSQKEGKNQDSPANNIPLNVEDKSSTQQVKRLLDSLIAQKNIYEEKRMG